MPRSGMASRTRLQHAAVALISERGFDAVTTAEIAERAGVTERTFFRHFPDKREVLFEGENQLADWITAALESIPSSREPLTDLRQAFQLIAPKLEGNRVVSEPLGQIIASTPALWERAAAKEATLVAMVANLLRNRGVDDETAEIAARIGWGVLAQAMNRWRRNADIGLQKQVERAFNQLHSITAASSNRHEPRTAST